ncbi:MAG TPA: phosphatase PAP2 family protein [Gemmatimonadaceae bacterium]|nr:phosphatase PAP2 family protein [Gemmatimonadaceae bacterium]
MRDSFDEIKRPLAARRPLALAITAATAATGFGALNAAIVHRRTAHADRTLGKGAKARRGHPARRAAKALAPIGKWYTYMPFAAALSLYLLAATDGSTTRRVRGRGPRLRPRRLTGAAAILVAGLLATGLNPLLDRWLPQPPPPPGRRTKRKSVFPSGHAFGPGAIALTAAYVLSREGVLRPGIAYPFALTIPAITAGARLVEEKHWVSDVAGGYLGAATLAAACLAAYESTRPGPA